MPLDALVCTSLLARQSLAENIRKVEHAHIPELSDRPLILPPRLHSCFAAGTLVQAGDLVRNLYITSKWPKTGAFWAVGPVLWCMMTAWLKPLPTGSTRCRVSRSRWAWFPLDPSVVARWQNGKF